MARRNNIYEIALEHALRMRGVPLVGVREVLQASSARRRFKNFDYLAYRPDQAHLVIEVKGRRCAPSGRGDPWVTAQDLSTLEGWQEYFGDAYRPIFAFVFDATGRESKGLPIHHRAFGRSWQLWAIDLHDYQRLARPRSAKWRTLGLSAQAFDGIATPLLSHFPTSDALDALPDELSGELLEANALSIA